MCIPTRQTPQINVGSRRADISRYIWGIRIPLGKNPDGAAGTSGRVRIYLRARLGKGGTGYVGVGLNGINRGVRVGPHLSGAWAALFS